MKTARRGCLPPPRATADADIRRVAHPASDRRRIVWIASWPKSGNTWTRLLLANVMAEETVSINQLPGSVASSRQRFDDLMGMESALLSDDEIDALRPEAYRAHARQAAAEGVPLLFYKAHDALHETPTGEPLFPADATVGAIYLLRNPLDVAVSLAFHSGHRNCAAAIRTLNARAGVVRARARHLRERRIDWSGHVASWMAAPFPVLPVRYEDLLADTPGELARMVRFLGLGGVAQTAKLRRAARMADFRRLREQEEREGFREFHEHARGARFFRSGSVGDWRQRLTAAQVRDVVDAHHRMMSAMGYAVRPGADSSVAERLWQPLASEIKELQSGPD